jgi:predicted HTH domain antitoxin
MPKVEFHTEQNERAKELANLAIQKYGTPYLSLKQAAEFMGMARYTLYCVVRDSKIEFSRSAGEKGSYIINAFDAVKFMEKHRQRTKP